MTQSYEIFSNLAIFLAKQRHTFGVLAFILAMGMGFVIWRFGKRVLSQEKWTQYFAAAFLFIALKYLMVGLLAAETFLFRNAWAESLRVMCYYAFSPLSSLLFLAAANAMLDIKQKIPSLLEKFPVNWLLKYVPIWVVIVALLAFLLSWLYLLVPYHLILNSFLTFGCLIYLGWAMFKNLNIGKTWGAGFLNLIGAGIYSFCNLIRGVFPIDEVRVRLVPQALWDGIQNKLVATPEMALSTVTVTEGLLTPILLILEIGLFLGGLAFNSKTLLVLVPEESSPLLKVSHGNMEYLAPEGVIGHLGSMVRADRVSLCFRVPGIHQEKVMWRRWPVVGEPIYETTPIPQKDNAIGQVLRTGESFICRDLAKQSVHAGEYIDTATKILVVIPLFYHKCITACLICEWYKPQAVTFTTVNYIRQMSDYMATPIQSKRRMMALDNLHRGLEGIIETAKHLPDFIRRATQCLHNQLAPDEVFLCFQFGFRHFGYRYNGESIFRDHLTSSPEDVIKNWKKACKLEQESEYITTPIKKGDNKIGYMICKLYSGSEKIRPNLTHNKPHAEMVASILGEAYFNAAQNEFNTILAHLHDQLGNKKTTTRESCQEALIEACRRARIDSVSFEESHQDFFNVDELVHIQDGRDDCKVSLQLKNSKAAITLRLPFQSRGEVTAETPWRLFLVRLATTADLAFERVAKQQIEEQAHRLELQATKMEIPAMLMHELNNKTREFSSGVRSIEEELRFPRPESLDKVKGYAARLKGSSANMGEMVKAFNQNFMVNDRPTATLAEALKSIDARYGALYQSRAIELILPDKPESKKLNLPLEVLVLVLSNLISNAADAIDQQGSIWIEQELNVDRLLCRVMNDGGTIDPDTREKIFNMGFTTKKMELAWAWLFQERLYPDLMETWSYLMQVPVIRAFF